MQRLIDRDTVRPLLRPQPRLGADVDDETDVTEKLEPSDAAPLSFFADTSRRASFLLIRS